MGEYRIQAETLTAIADAIRAKTGGNTALTPTQMVIEINNIGFSDPTFSGLYGTCSASGGANRPGDHYKWESIRLF